VKNKILNIIKISAISGLIIWAAFKFDMQTARLALSSAVPLWGILSILTAFLVIYVISLRWLTIIKGFYGKNRVNIFSLFYFNLLSTFYTLFIPTSIAGEAVRVVKLSNKTDRVYSKATLVIALDRLLGLLTWFIIFLLSPSPFKNSKYWLLLLIPAGAIFFFGKKFKFMGHEVFDFSRHHPRDIFYGFMVSFAGQFLVILTNFLIIKCFRLNISFFDACGITAIAALAGIVPLAWLGVSLREGSYLAVLPMFGASHTQSLLFVSLVVFTTYLLGFTGGVTELAKSGWDFSKLRKEAEEDINIAKGETNGRQN